MKQLPGQGTQQNQRHARPKQSQRRKLGVQQEEPHHPKPKGKSSERAITGHQTAMPGIKTPTSRHIILTSDGPLGRFLNLRLNVHAPYSVILRQATKIRSLR